MTSSCIFNPSFASQHTDYKSAQAGYFLIVCAQKRGCLLRDTLLLLESSIIVNRFTIATCYQLPLVYNQLWDHLQKYVFSFKSFFNIAWWNFLYIKIMPALRFLAACKQQLLWRSYLNVPAETINIKYYYPHQRNW